MKPQLSCIFVCLALAQIGFAQPQNKVTQRIPTTIEVDVKNEQSEVTTMKTEIRIQTLSAVTNSSKVGKKELDNPSKIIDMHKSSPKSKTHEVSGRKGMDPSVDQDGRAHVWTPVTSRSRMPSSAWKKKKKKNNKKQTNKQKNKKKTNKK